MLDEIGKEGFIVIQGRLHSALQELIHPSPDLGKHQMAHDVGHTTGYGIQIDVIAVDTPEGAHNVAKDTADVTVDGHHLQFTFVADDLLLC
ncbi:hypothetical protein DSECCO2_587820 [anaerobic digester metagenome]